MCNRRLIDDSPHQLVGGVHKLNDINSLTYLDIISHKVSKEYKQTIEIIKMKMFAIV